MRALRHGHAPCRHADADREREGRGPAARHLRQDHDHGDDIGDDDGGDDDHRTDDGNNDDANHNHNPDDRNDNNVDHHHGSDDGNVYVVHDDDSDNHTDSDSDSYDLGHPIRLPKTGCNAPHGDDAQFDGLDEIVSARAARAPRAAKKARRAPPKIDISWGELVDRYTILRLKRGKAKEPRQAVPLDAELAKLQREMDWFLKSIPGAAGFHKRMKLINARLWRLEDTVRALIRADDTGPSFIMTARSIAVANDKRSGLKVAINRVAVSGLEEVKIYRPG